MTKPGRNALWMGATALSATLALTAPVSAQELSDNCRALANLVEAVEGEEISPDFRDALETAQANDDVQCVAYIERIDVAGGLLQRGEAEGEVQQTADMETETESFEASETVTRTVEITEDVIVEGDVMVSVPQPEIAVEQDGATVEIVDSPAAVSVDQPAADIVIRQAQPIITVDMPSPRITIEQQAPEIIITMPRPGVDVTEQEPQVEIVMAEPRVTVTQGDPELDVNVQARFAEDGEEIDPNNPTIQTRTARIDAEGNEVESDEMTDFELTQTDPMVTLTRSSEESEVTYSAAEPRVTFESAEPQVTLNFSEDIQVEFVQVGETSVTFQQDADEMDRADASDAMIAEDETEMAAADGDATMTGEMSEEEQMAAAEEGEGTMRRSAEESAAMLSATDEAGRSGEVLMTEMRVADLIGRDVENAQGESLGEISRIVSNNGRVNAIVEHGGFLGFGESEVALPLDRMAFAGDTVILQGLTEEELEAMPEYDFNRDELMDNESMIEVNTAG